MTTDQFLRAWPEHDDVGRVGFVGERKDDLPPSNCLEAVPDDFLTIG